MRNDLGIKSAELVRLSSLRVEQGVRDILGVLVGKFQAQRLSFVAILPDADRQNVQPRPGRLFGAGHALHIDPRRRHIGYTERAPGFTLLQDERQRIGTIQLGIADTGTVSAALSGPRLTSQRSTPCAPGVAA